MSRFHKLLDHKLLIVTGKGGTGKSFLTALFAIHAARSGKKVLIVEKSQCEQITPLFGVEPVGHQEHPLSENIFGINLSTKECYREYIADYLGYKKLFETVFTNPIVENFLT